MGWAAAIAGIFAYCSCAALVARMLFVRWRPSRVPLCGAARHYSSGCQVCYTAYRTGKACQREHHTDGCYRRRKADQTTVHIDHDSHAAGWAVAASLVWPFVLAGLLMMHRPPALPEEKAKAVKDMERDAGIGQ
jgi:hypothetical protein